MGLVNPIYECPPEFDAIGHMVRAVSHRGPDSSGTYVDSHVALGSTRLAVIDRSDAGNMPMVDPLTGGVLVFNGEIYNHRELCSKLGLKPRGRSDSEVLMLALLKHGIEIVRELNGIFSFAFWNPLTQELFLARDRLGVKPLFYSLQSDSSTLVFGSEIKALLASGIRPEPNVGIISDYLMTGRTDHSDETFFKGIFSFPAGEYGRFSKKGGGLTTQAYWSILSAPKETPESLDEAANHFNDLALDSISLQSMGDVGVSVNLSSGLDSAYLLAAFNSLNGGQGEVQASSYHYGGVESEDFSGTHAILKSYGWNADFDLLHWFEVPELLREAMPFFEEPFPGIVSLAKFNSFRAAERGVKTVVIEGQGGDEIGAGYPYAMGPRVLDLLTEGNASQAEAEVSGYASSRKIGIEEAFRRIFVSIGGSQGGATLSADGSHIGLSDLLSTAKLEPPQPVVLPDIESHLDLFLYRDLFHTKMPRILRACDRSSMAFGKELRVPLLDHRLVEFMFHLPGHFKIHNGVQRVTQRRALELLGDRGDSGSEPKKAVVDPQRDWLKGPLREWARQIIASESLADRGFFNRELSLRAFDEYCGQPLGTGNAFRFWQMISLEYWFREFID